MKRYIVRCADFSCFVSMNTYGETAPERVPIGSFGITLYPTDLADFGVTVSGGRLSRDYLSAIVAQLFVKELGFPLGVFSALFDDGVGEIEIRREDREFFGIRIGECEKLSSGRVTGRDGVSLSFCDVECDEKRVRIFPVSDSRSFSHDALRTLLVSPRSHPADVALAVSVSDRNALAICSCHPIPSFAVRSLSHYVKESFTDITRITDVFTSSTYTVDGGFVRLPFWCGEIG